MKKKMGLLLICCLMVLTPITSYAKSHDIEKNVVARKIEVIPKEVVELNGLVAFQEDNHAMELDLNNLGDFIIALLEVLQQLAI